MARVFLDANVFLYAIGSASPYREACRELLDAAGDGAFEAVTSTEVLQEILHIRSRRVDIRDAVAGLVEEWGLDLMAKTIDGKYYSG